MSAISQTPSERPSIYSYAAKAVNIVVTPGLCIIPIFPLLMRKSDLQIGKGGNPYPSMWTGLKEGCKAAPTVGIIVGSQIVVQSIVETGIIKLCGTSKEGEPSIGQMLASAAIVGAITAPALAVFNGQTMGKGIMESISGMTPKQVAAITARETSFLAGLKLSRPVSEHMKKQYGDNLAIQVGSQFFMGVASTLAAHPCDTILTWEQKEITGTSYRNVMRGGATKAVGIGIFNVLYNQTSEMVKKLAE